MATKTHLKIIRIPCDGSPMELKTIALMIIGPERILEDECNSIEKELKHIPDIKSFDKPEAFSWDHRDLFVSHPVNNAGFESWWGDYMVYMSLNGDVGLPRNAHLQPLMQDLDKKGRATAMEEVKVYGDAFVCKKASTSSGSESGWAAYVDMDGEFIGGLDLKAGGTLATAILRRLLMYPYQKASGQA